LSKLGFISIACLLIPVHYTQLRSRKLPELPLTSNFLTYFTWSVLRSPYVGYPQFLTYLLFSVAMNYFFFRIAESKHGGL